VCWCVCVFVCVCVRTYADAAGGYGEVSGLVCVFSCVCVCVCVFVRVCKRMLTQQEALGR